MALLPGCASAPQSMLASASMATPPSPPDSPRPASSFSVEFVPARTEHYPPTEAKDVVRFKNVVHWPGQPDEVLGAVQPTTRPYVRVGELRLGESWYYHAQQSAVARVHLDSGNPEDVYFQSIVLEVIRYTDR